MTDHWFQALAEIRARHADSLESFTLRGVKDSIVENTPIRPILSMNYCRMRMMPEQPGLALNYLRTNCCLPITAAGGLH